MLEEDCNPLHHGGQVHAAAVGSEAQQASWSFTKSSSIIGTCILMLLRTDCKGVWEAYTQVMKNPCVIYVCSPTVDLWRGPKHISCCALELRLIFH